MHRTALVVIVLAALGALPAAALAGAIDLRISYQASDAATPRTLTLRCDPLHGTVARPGTACRRLRAIGADAFAPTPRGMRLCAQLYGGPMMAVVTGSYYGRSVWTRLTRRDGCAIARWNRVAFLFPQVPEAHPGRAPGN
jgi:hypothetical protein